ncbi:hypothetical protein FT663_00811 [Candidozyma haemuli var. vulneris]|uniref:Non-haem dioxygenase N-terminal domain-containing protein n=1 Tax=Candidozyma haemuli TaxID=45357 RepID=A0A2V1APV6_9ASCO|nr:hypothetical protein CXQ85_001663 [[Candida] haemuloni]KAF3992901.1 hypothetical protein FT662_00903 [[Candida] haemuloni var. vulneris]KAF3995112.1 hypothetical protein FT663_00811 [[Candida] haemuloni var. vulneris]PVH19888.1 hypothetical protein CXQ85_001663 [[Candida] haemuloni]
MSTEAVSVTLEELNNGLDFETLNKAFGPDSLGIIIVKDLPDHFQSLRLKVLESISVLANLPEDELKKLESPESMWLTGWSCGKEVLSSTGEPDFNKGSYYVNCAFYKKDELEGPEPRLAEKFKDFQTYVSPNIWPPETIDRLQNFKTDCKDLIKLIISTAAKVAKNCDSYISVHAETYEKNFLQRIIKESTCTKARLLHYFPNVGDKTGNSDDWCGEHLDHSCLTGLTSALFLDESKDKPESLDKSPDPEAGLYIKNRQGEVQKVNIPKDCLAFQSGQALQEISKGFFKAVPHYVQGTSIPHIARNTLAVFCQPDLDEMVNDTENFAQFAQRIVTGNH